MTKHILFATIGATALTLASAASAATLDDVKARGKVICGVSTGLAGFSNPNDAGEWSGIDVDVCRAVAAAIFGDATKASFVPLTPKERFTALQSGEIDVLTRNTTETFQRDTEIGDFIGINYYDGQGFMVPKSLGVSSAAELDGATVCIQTGTTTELNLADYFSRNGMSYQTVVVEALDEVKQNYANGACDVYTTDASGLAALRSTLPDPSAHLILPELISKEPLGPMVRHGDNAWGDLVRWSLRVMIIAEELGVTSENAQEMAETSKNPEIRRMLGVDDDMGAKLKLSKDWAMNIITQVGNYGESFARNLGPDTPIALERGLNAQWNNGGILYAPPLR